MEQQTTTRVFLHPAPVTDSGSGAPICLALESENGMPSVIKRVVELSDAEEGEYHLFVPFSRKAVVVFCELLSHSYSTTYVFPILRGKTLETLCELLNMCDYFDAILYVSSVAAVIVDKTLDMDMAFIVPLLNPAMTSVVRCMAQRGPVMSLYVELSMLDGENEVQAFKVLFERSLSKHSSGVVRLQILDEHEESENVCADFPDVTKLGIYLHTCGRCDGCIWCEVPNVLINSRQQAEEIIKDGLFHYFDPDMEYDFNCFLTSGFNADCVISECADDIRAQSANYSQKESVLHKLEKALRILFA